MGYSATILLPFACFMRDKGTQGALPLQSGCGSSTGCRCHQPGASVWFNDPQKGQLSQKVVFPFLV